MRSLLRRLLLAAALRLGPARKPAEGLRIQVTCDTSRARAALAELEALLAQTAAQRAERERLIAELKQQTAEVHDAVARARAAVDQAREAQAIVPMWVWRAP